MKTIIIILGLLCIAAAPNGEITILPTDHSGGISLLPGRTLAPEVIELRSMVYDYAAALISYDAAKEAEYVMREARFRESQRVRNLSAESMAMLDKVREQMRRELARIRSLRESREINDLDTVSMVETVLTAYRQAEAVLAREPGATVITKAEVVR